MRRERQEAIAGRVSISRIFILPIAVVVLWSTVFLSAYSDGKNVQVTLTVNNKDIHVGDRINAEIDVDNADGMEISFPKIPSELGDFSFYGMKPAVSGSGRKSVTGRIYVMGIYSTGIHVIPPIPVKYRKKGSKKWETVESPQIPVTVKSTLTGKDTDIRDIKGILKIRSSLFFIFLLLFILIAGVAGYLLYDRLKKRRIYIEEQKRKKPAHEVAYDELNDLRRKDLPSHGMVKEYYSSLSDIIRHYLENRFFLRAPEMTTEEFMGIARNSSDIESGHKDLLNDFLYHCDMVKFAKYGPTPLEIIDSFNSAKRFVDQTKKVEEEEEKEAEE